MCLSESKTWTYLQVFDKNTDKPYLWSLQLPFMNIYIQVKCSYGKESHSQWDCELNFCYKQHFTAKIKVQIHSNMIKAAKVQVLLI